MPCWLGNIFAFTTNLPPFYLPTTFLCQKGGLSTLISATIGEQKASN